MFGIGMPEMIIILAVALIVFGPKRLPELAKSLGRALGEFKRATSDLKQSIETDTGLDEVRNSLDGVKKDFKSQVDLTDSTQASASTPSSNESVADEPLSQLKTAFDTMNADVEPSPQSCLASESESEISLESENESEAAPAIDPDTKPQDKTTP